MNREEAVQQAREFAVYYLQRPLTEIRGITGESMALFAAKFADCYAADRVRAELEELAKEMCPRCALGNIPNAALYHFMPIPGRDIEECSTKCKAAPIRARLALLEGEK